MKNNLSPLLIAAALSLALSATLHALPPNAGAGQGKQGGKLKERILERFDKNNNGVLDPDERAELEKFREERRKERLAKFDTNGDGKLDEAELEAAKGGLGKHHFGKGKHAPPAPSASPTPAS